MDDKAKTESSGQQNHGDFYGLFSCQLNKAVAPGAEIYLPSSPTHPDLLHMGSLITLILKKPAATLCVCLAQEPSFGVSCCALDAEGRVITAAKVKFAGPVNLKQNGNGSCSTKNTGTDRETQTTGKSTGSIIRKKSSTRKPENGK